MATHGFIGTAAEPDQELERSLRIGHRRLPVEEFTDTSAMDIQFPREECPISPAVQVRLHHSGDRIPKRSFRARSQGRSPTQPRFPRIHSLARLASQLSRRQFQNLHGGE